MGERGIFEIFQCLSRMEFGLKEDGESFVVHGPEMNQRFCAGRTTDGMPNCRNDFDWGACGDHGAGFVIHRRHLGRIFEPQIMRGVQRFAFGLVLGPSPQAWK